ncbi:MAG: hypothetical protein LUE87_09380, partial [Lachnospiraceae bacterium]|nr:hypothetical protein [Lachnospiraceae bacterium]
SFIHTKALTGQPSLLQQWRLFLSLGQQDKKESHACRQGKTRDPLKGILIREQIQSVSYSTPIISHALTSCQCLQDCSKAPKIVSKPFPA